MEEKKQALESVRCSALWTIYEKQDFSIVQYEKQSGGETFAALGNGLPTQKSLLVELFGQWAINPKDGKEQFRVEYFEICHQTDEEGVIAYLISLHCGVGQKKAKAIYKHFKEATWTIIQDQPHRLMEVSGIGASLTDKIIAKSQQTLGLKDVILTFIRSNAKITAWQASAFLKAHPTDPMGALKRNPYCACEIDGISFDKADAVAEYFGFPPDHPFRVKAYVSKLLNNAAMKGHVCYPIPNLIDEMMDKLAVDEQQVREALNAAWQDGFIKTTNGMVYTAKSYQEEKSISTELTRLLKADLPELTEIEPMIDAYEKENFTLADSQRDAVRSVFTSPVSIITGGPGTGKTTVIKAVLNVHESIYGEDSQPILLAPTGRAARRMTEATGHYAQTIHSAIGFRGNDVEADEDIILDGNLIIVDETSMMDQHIASELFSKCTTGTRVVLVGDPDQLPSVGSGNVLLDLIQSGCIPTTKLTVIYRQQGDNPIVYNAHAINEGRVDLLWSRTFKRLECCSNEEIFNTAIDFYIRCVKAYGIDNVILLNPQRNHTSVSVDAFNKELQERLNPHSDSKPEFTSGKNVFRIGDKVMQLKNTENAKNGDVGYIRDIRQIPSADDPEMKVLAVYIEFNGEGALQCYNTDDMRSIDLAYCSTIHKSQGEEYRTVIMVVSKAHPTMLRRNLVYTGITRAKENLCIITEATNRWEQSALDKAILNASCDQRYTNLVPRLQYATKN